MPSGSGNSMTVLIVQLVVIVALFYFLMIRPQQKKNQEATRIRESIRVGSEVVTIGGIVGKVVKVTEDNIIMSTGTGDTKTTITFRKAAIATNLTIDKDETKNSKDAEKISSDSSSDSTDEE